MKGIGLLLIAACGFITCGCKEKEALGSGVAAHGQLRVEKTSIIDEHGKNTVLRGMSSHGITWYPRYLNGGAMETLRSYGANVFRIAVYTEPSGAYLDDPELSLNYMYMGVESALAADLYVIVDWHILKDGNPNLYAKEAERFFGEVSSRYKDEPGVLYEICNEPNGDTDWNDIKKYAAQIIPVIRKNAPDALILVGTPDYCTDFLGPLAEPLEYENVMYSMHCYIDASSPDSNSASSLTDLMDAGLPVFVTEWGLSHEKSGDKAETEMANIYPELAQPFLEEMSKYGISWTGWSLSNKAEVHSAIQADCTKLSGWTQEDLTVSGKLMFSNFGE